MESTVNRPKLLDLFCCAGGASTGYHLAGFDVVGVDMNPQPHYPFPLVIGDAFEYAAAHGHEYDAIHASPPCQWASQTVSKQSKWKKRNLIGPVRELLSSIDCLSVIENIQLAKEHLINPLLLCGSSFGLPIRRHRLFEISPDVPIWGQQCSHKEYPRKYPPAFNRVTPLRVLSLSGGFTRRGGVALEEYKKAMGVTWEVTLQELSNAIPPAYTEYIGQALIEHLARTESDLSGLKS